MSQPLTDAKYPNWRDAIPLKRALYAVHCAGGYAHVVSDDENVEDCFIEACIASAEVAPLDDPVAGPSLVLLRAMRRMSRTQRLKLCAYNEQTAVNDSPAAKGEKT